MTSAAVDTLRVVLLIDEASVRESVDRALEGAGLRPLHWLPADFGSPGEPPMQPDALVVGPEGVDVPALMRRGQEAGWLRSATPVVVLANGPLDRAAQRRWLEAGVWDVVRLPVDADLFGLRIRNFLRGRGARVPALEGPEAGTPEPYSRLELIRVAGEALSLARRYDRPFSAAAFCLDWGARRGQQEARDVMRRLAAAAQEAARGSDLVGVTQDAVLLVLLPETDAPGARLFTDRLAGLFEQRLREWETLGRVRAEYLEADRGGEMTPAMLIRELERLVG